MGRVKGKTVFISGASSGIGKACAEVFAEKGARLIITARTLSNLKKVADEISSRFKTEVLPVELDVTKRDAVKTTIENLPAEWQGIDILINNAGLALGLEKLHEGNIDDWEIMIDTNVKGLLYLTRSIVPGMVARGYGQVINIGSTAGMAAYANGGVYCATKSAVRILSDGLRIDTVDKPIRVTNIQPGMVETNFSNVRFKGDSARASSYYIGVKPLSGKDIADTVLYAASVPENVQITELTVTPACQATGTVVYREN